MPDSLTTAHAGPPPMLARLSEDEWQTVLVRSLREPLFAGFRLPGFPADDVQAQFVGSSGEAALEEAFAFYRHACRALRRYSSPLAAGDLVLDFGCGWGRILRFFLRDVSERDLFGVDPMPAAIELCRAHSARGNVLLIHDLPPLPLRTERFKLIYAFSVFSHLPKAAASAWIEELASLLLPGGMLVLTSRGTRFIDHLTALPQRPRAKLSLNELVLLEQLGDLDVIRTGFEAGEHVFVDLGGATEGLSAELYGEAFVPERHVRRVWTQWLELKEFEDRPRGLNQSLIVMRKTGAGRLRRF